MLRSECLNTGISVSQLCKKNIVSCVDQLCHISVQQCPTTVYSTSHLMLMMQALFFRCCFLGGSNYCCCFVLVMASYADWIVFRAAILSADLLNRTQFSDIVKYSHVRDLGGLPDTLATRALLAAQALHLVPPHRACPTCEMPFKLYASRVDAIAGLGLGMKAKAVKSV